MDDTKGDHIEIKNNFTILQMKVTEEHKIELNVYSFQDKGLEINTNVNSFYYHSFHYEKVNCKRKRA